jgi:hypothetical protein
VTRPNGDQPARRGEPSGHRGLTKAKAADTLASCGSGTHPCTEAPPNSGEPGVTKDSVAESLSPDEPGVIPVPPFTPAQFIPLTHS